MRLSSIVGVAEAMPIWTTTLGAKNTKKRNIKAKIKMMMTAPEKGTVRVETKTA